MRHSGGETEQALLNETVPPWVTEIVVDKNMPKFNKIPFFLQPHARYSVILSLFIFVRDGIENSDADYSSSRVDVVCVYVYVLISDFHDGITFECIEIEG